MIGKSFTFESLAKTDPNRYNRIKNLEKFNKEVRTKVRHKIINSSKDFDDETLTMLSELKKEAFKENDIFIRGSMIKGTYISEKEFKKYSLLYPGIKKSDIDIMSNYTPTKSDIESFEKKYKVKIDFKIGSKGIKI